jgi:PKD repeat protein
MRSSTVYALGLIAAAILLAGCSTQSPAGTPTYTVSPTETPGPVTQTPCAACTSTLVPPAITTPTIRITTTTVPIQSTPATFAGEPPITRFIANTTSGKAPLTVAFTDRSTGSPDSWAWDFGDGSTSADRNPVHTYASPGTYTVRLVASNGAGSNSETKVYYITINAAFQPPGASFTGFHPVNSQEMTVQFIDRSSGPPTSWSWDFGDGGTSNLQNPVHTYSNPGTYIVTLTVSNSAGSSETTGFVTFG